MKRRGKAGVTLMELLVAITLLSLLSHRQSEELLKNRLPLFGGDVWPSSSFSIKAG